MLKRLADSKPLLIFLHLPKTAGSTLAYILERQYGSGGVLALYDSFFGEELVTVPQSQLERTKVITGHFYFGAHTFISKPSTYITFLREPVDRVISHYYYVRRDPTHYLYPLAREMSLREYVESCGLCEPNNDQTRLLAGKDLATKDGACSTDMLPVAKKNLQEHFAVVGISEAFDQSLLLMKQVFGWRHPYYSRQNVSRHRIKNEDIPPKTIRTIHSYNELDCELYGYATEILQKQIALQAEPFKQEVHLFQMMNAYNDRLHRIAGRATNSARWQAHKLK
jgi:hypothetical protein